MAFIAVVAGAAGSVGSMLRVGQRNDSTIPVVLLILFTGWVLSPFLGLVLAELRSKQWPVRARTTLHSLMLLLALGSLAIYGYVALSPPRPKPASTFLLVPLGSWLLLTIVLLVSGGRSQRGNHG